MKHSKHYNITTWYYGFECPYCGLMCREMRVSRNHIQTDGICDCEARYVIYWISEVTA